MRFKAETTERLTPRAKCYCFRHYRASRIQKLSLLANHGDQQYFSVLHGPFEIHFAGTVFNINFSYVISMFT